MDGYKRGPEMNDTDTQLELLLLRIALLNARMDTILASLRHTMTLLNATSKR